MSRLHMKFGIAGMPRGATHTAAAMFGVGHETDSNAHGVADFCIAVRPLPPIRLFLKMQRGHPNLAHLMDNVDYDYKLLVVREPWDVLQTYDAIHRNDLCSAMAWPFKDLRMPYSIPQAITVAPVELAAKIMVRWYQISADWAKDGFYRAEDPGWVLDKFDLVVPCRKNKSSVPKRYLETIKSRLTPETTHSIETLRKDFGYE